MDEFLIFLEDNMELADSIYREYYEEQAVIEGEAMMGEERFGGADNFEEDPTELYEKYAHAAGHSAHYYGACGVIRELGCLNGYDVEDDDEELQWEILLMLEKEF